MNIKPVVLFLQLFFSICVTAFNSPALRPYEELHYSLRGDVDQLLKSKINFFTISVVVLHWIILVYRFMQVASKPCLMYIFMLIFLPFAYLVQRLSGSLPERSLNSVIAEPPQAINAS